MTLSSRGGTAKNSSDTNEAGPLVNDDDFQEEKEKSPRMLVFAAKWAGSAFFVLLAVNIMLLVTSYVKQHGSPRSQIVGTRTTTNEQKWAAAVTDKCGHPRRNPVFLLNGKTAKPGNCTLGWEDDVSISLIHSGQNLEDAVIFSRFFTGSSPMAHLGRSNGNGEAVGGVFLEMGGLDGLTFSNSIILEYCAGWDGVLIEANPNNAKLLFENRPCAVVIPEGVCGKKGGTIRMSKGEGTSFDLSTREGSTTTAADEGVDVPCRPLSDMLEEYGVKRINFFSLDVEGAELKVLETFDFRKVKIDVLMVEADFMTDAQKNLGEEVKREHQKTVEAVRTLVEKSGMKRVPSRLDGENSDKRLCARNGKSGTGTYDCIFLSIAGSDVFVSPELYEYDTKPWEFGKQVSDQ